MMKYSKFAYIEKKINIPIINVITSTVPMLLHQIRIKVKDLEDKIFDNKLRKIIIEKMNTYPI